MGHIKRYQAICDLFPNLDIRLVLNKKSEYSKKIDLWSNNNLEDISNKILSSEGIFVDTFIASEKVFKLFETSKKLIVIDDYLLRNWRHGLIIDWTMNSQKKRKKVGEKSLFGSRYLTVRNSFRSYNWKPYKSSKDINSWRIGTIFGGNDPLSLSEKVYQEFKNKKNVRHFGTSNYTSYKKYKNNSKFFFNLKENKLAEELSKCHLVVSAGGQTLYELASMGVPSCCVLTSVNQKFDCDGFISSGLSISIKLSTIIKGELINDLKKINFKELQKMSKICLKSMGDGQLLKAEVKKYLCI